MNRYFRYEEKLIDEALDSISIKKVLKARENIKNGINNYLIVYSSKLRKFIGISDSRFLSHNYASAILIEDAADILGKERLLKKIGGGVYDTEVKTLLFGYDNYINDYGDNGYEILKDNIVDNIVKKVGYAIVYQHYPLIKEVVEAGHYSFIDSAIDDYFFIRENSLLMHQMKDWNISSDILDHLKKENYSCDEYDSLNKLFAIESISVKQLKYLKDNEVDIPQFCSLIINNKDVYTVKNLIEYIKRNIDFHYFKGSNLYKLAEYLRCCRNCGIRINYFPFDLNSEYDHVSTLDYIVSNKTRDKDNIKHYRDNVKDRNKGNYHDDRYCIAAENDPDYLSDKGCLFMLFKPSPRKDEDFYWLYDKYTDKIKALISVYNGKYQAYGFRQGFLNKKERRLIANWFYCYKKKGACFA